MNKSDFRPGHRYTVALHGADGRTRPANFEVYRAYETFMVVRVIGQDGLLRKLAYGDVARIVHAAPVDAAHLRSTPAALLEEKFWAGREQLAHYASSPALGK